MKLFSKIIAVLTGLAAFATLPATVFAEETTTETEDTINYISTSPYLKGDSNGTVMIHLNGGRSLRILIRKETMEGTFTYYNTVLEEDGSYCFMLDACEYDVYSEDYISSFNITIQDEKDNANSYSYSNIVIADPGFSLGVTTTQYAWNVQAEASESRSLTYTDPVLEQSETLWFAGGAVSMESIPYTLGDVNNDDAISITDALITLQYYSTKASGKTATFVTDGTEFDELVAFSAADIDKDNLITITDASSILKYYSEAAAGKEATWQ